MNNDNEAKSAVLEFPPGIVSLNSQVGICMNGKNQSKDRMKGMKHIIRIILSVVVVVSLALNVSAEDVRLQASVPGEAGTVELVVQLDEANPPMMENYSSIGPGPSTVPEPSTLALIGLGIAALVGWRRFRRQG